MTHHYNSSLSARALDIFKTKTGDHLPAEVLPYIVPTVELADARRMDVFGQAGASNATQATILTTASDKDTYITAASLGVIKDATSTSTFTSIRCTVNGVTVTVLIIPGITLTAQSEVTTITLPRPIKVDRGTAITVNNDTNVANISARACVFGFVQEN